MHCARPIASKMSAVRLQRERDHRKMQWRNGTGSTLEIAAVPTSDAWDWRLSMAEVSTDGAFSLLPGVDRALLVASGTGMILRINEQDHTIRHRDVFRFDGASDTACSLLDGPVRDLNFMVRRDAHIGQPSLELISLVAGSTIAFGEALGLVVLEGIVTLTTFGDSFPFAPLVEHAKRFDAVLADGPALQRTACVVRRDAVVVVASLRRDV